jgi:GTP-binding protein
MIEMMPNDSPGMGQDGNICNINQLRGRLQKETENDVALQISEGGKKSNSKTVKVIGRGDLHLGVLFEKMRREGFEFSVSPPEIPLQMINNVLFEPMQKVTVELEETFEKNVLDMMLSRKGEVITCDKVLKGKISLSKLVFKISARGFIGCNSEILGKTRGTAIIQEEYIGLEKHKGNIKRNNHGSIISQSDGKATIYALAEIQKKGTLFINPGAIVYPGMVIGQHVMGNDIEMNPCKMKRMTNVRTHNHEELIKLKPPRVFAIDQALAYIREDELVEVTPKNVRIRMRILDAAVRHRATRAAKTAAQEKEEP